MQVNHARPVVPIPHPISELPQGSFWSRSGWRHRASEQAIPYGDSAEGAGGAGCVDGAGCVGGAEGVVGSTKATDKRMTARISMHSMLINHPGIDDLHFPSSSTSSFAIVALSLPFQSDFSGYLFCLPGVGNRVKADVKTRDSVCVYTPIKVSRLRLGVGVTTTRRAGREHPDGKTASGNKENTRRAPNASTDSIGRGCYGFFVRLFSAQPETHAG